MRASWQAELSVTPRKGGGPPFDVHGDSVVGKISSASPLPLGRLAQ